LIGIPVSFSPSATPLLTDDKIELMKKVGVKAVSLSLDGSDERTHDEFRGVDLEYILLLLQLSLKFSQMTFLALHFQ